MNKLNLEFVGSYRLGCLNKSSKIDTIFFGEFEMKGIIK